jgi:hypothetical protein
MLKPFALRMLAILAVVLLPLVALQATAQEPQDESAASSDTTPDGTFHVRIVSGGIGDDMELLKSVEKQYDLKILFTETGGAYISDVQVRIEDSKGLLVAEDKTKGPILLVNLPTGTYKVTASYAGETKIQKVSVRLKSLRGYQIRYQTTE